MSAPPRSSFQKAVSKQTPAQAREDAINRLIESGATRELRTIVLASGLDARFRRQAIDGLGRANGTAALEMLAGDRSLHPVLRSRAKELQ